MEIIVQNKDYKLVKVKKNYHKILNKKNGLMELGFEGIYTLEELKKLFEKECKNNFSIL